MWSLQLHANNIINKSETNKIIFLNIELYLSCFSEISRVKKLSIKFIYFYFKNNWGISQIRNIAQKIVDTYLYSSLHIAICAICLTLYTYHRNAWQINEKYIYFIVFGTILIYTLHRVVGLKKLKSPPTSGRFAVVQRNYNLLIFLILLSGLGCAFLILQLSSTLVWVLLVTGSISCLYTLPMISGSRLRDLPFIKIFLIAIVWTLITETAPSLENNLDSKTMIWKGVERFLYMIALTLPFDLRDLDIDKDQKVSTLAASLGARNTIFLSTGLLAICMAITILTSKGFYDHWPLLIMYGLTTLAIVRYGRKQHDYFFSGLLDGMMCIPYLVWYISN